MACAAEEPLCALARTPRLEANGLTHASPGQRPGNGTQQRASPEGAGQNHALHFGIALSGLARSFTHSQGVALGWFVFAPLVLKRGVRV
jgi:hypothetical protein